MFEAEVADDLSRLMRRALDLYGRTVKTHVNLDIPGFKIQEVYSESLGHHLMRLWLKKPGELIREVSIFNVLDGNPKWTSPMKADHFQHLKRARRILQGILVLEDLANA